MTCSTVKNAWRDDGLRYFKYSYFLKNLFGVNVYRVSLDAGLSCPNIDGTISKEGCIFCDNASFAPSMKHRGLTITEQIDKQLPKLRHRYDAEKFLAYFQTGTNTYGDIETLKILFKQATEHPDIIGLIIGTRPDSISEECLEMISEFQNHFYVSLEYGLQSIHNKTLSWMNRGHSFEQFAATVHKTKKHNIAVTAHVILGFPNESTHDVLATAEEISKLPLQAVKIHNLHVVKNTTLEKIYKQGQLKILDKSEYLDLLISFIEHLSPNLVIQRLVSDIPRRYLLAPEWTHQKDQFLIEFEQELIKRDTWQGKYA